MSEGEMVRKDAVVRHEDPLARALFDRVQRVARGRLHELHDERMGVVRDQPVEGRLARHFLR